MSDLLGIATSGLMSVQRALDTISHNISNANTPGYSRQQDIFATRPPNQIGSNIVGSGVDVAYTRRVANQFVIDNLRSQTSRNSEFTTVSQLFEDVDIMLSDPATGISEGLNQFFVALQELNNSPSSVPARQLFISQAELLQNRFEGLNAQIEDHLDSTDKQLGFLVNEVNSLGQSLAELNVKITALGGTTFNSPNDLLDQRDQLILELSQYVDLMVNEKSDGSADVLMGNGLSLVTGGNSSRLQVTTSDTGPNLDVYLLSDAGGRQNITSNIGSGEMGGLIKMRDGALSELQNSMGRIAITVASTINSQLSNGLDLNGDLGTNLFADVNALDAMQSRSIKSINNAGDAVFNVAIDPIRSQKQPPFVKFSNDSNIVATSSLPILVNNAIQINNINIRGTTAADDTVSSAGNLGSAIAIANAINTNSAQHKVTARAEANTLSLGQFTPGAFAAGEFTINGVSVVTTGADNATLIQDINALSTQTGVVATEDAANNISLTAIDGRNIQLTSNTNTPVATFTHFDTNSAVALDQIQRASVSLNATKNFTVAGNNPGLVGLTPGNTPGEVSALTTSDYLLSFDGSIYRLHRNSDQTLVAQSATPNLSVDGFSINLVSGTMQANDLYTIQPTKLGSQQFESILKDPNKLALAFPVSAEANLQNTGTGKIQVTNIVDVSGLPVTTSTKLGNAFSSDNQLTPPIRIEFVNDSTYRVYNMLNGEPGEQIGPDQQYDPTNPDNQVFPIAGVADNTLPGPNSTYVYDPGYRLSLTGEPQAGDSFNIGFNHDADSDNRNANILAAIQTQNIMSSGKLSLEGAVGEIVSKVATQASQAQVNLQTSDSFLKSIESRRNDISGVNLEEEAANLLKFEQSYQAIAQLFSISRDNFSFLLSMLGG